LAELSAARGHMDESLPLLQAASVGEALPHQKDALDELEKLAALLGARQKESTEALSRKISSTRCAVIRSKTIRQPTRPRKWSASSAMPAQAHLGK